MRAVITRVNSASVTIDGKEKARIGKGFLVLLGVHTDDTEEKAKKMAIAQPFLLTQHPETLNQKIDNLAQLYGISREEIRKTCCKQPLCCV